MCGVVDLLSGIRVELLSHEVIYWDIYGVVKLYICILVEVYSCMVVYLYTC